MLTRFYMTWMLWITEKENAKKIIQFLIFTLIVSLPFVNMTYTLGLETFLDSFEKPEAYLCLKNSDKITGIEASDEIFFIIQRKNHPDFNIQESDTVIYCKINGDISCSKIFDVKGVGIYTRYYVEDKIKNEDKPIFKNQIIGKVIKQIDKNIWNQLLIKLWELSIHNLNIRGLTRSF